MTFGHHRHGQNVVHLHRVTDVPEPQFDTVPNSPVLTPVMGTHFEPNNRFATEDDVQAFYGVPRFQSHMPVQHAQSHGHNNAGPHHLTRPTSGQYSSGAYTFTHQSTVAPSIEAQQIGYPFVTGSPASDSVHSLPMPYNHESGPPPHNHLPFAYSEPRPDANFPAAPLPGSVIRGFTGHGNGVGT